MAATKVLFVFRKPNPGNFSIEKVYAAVYKELQGITTANFTWDRITLKRNFDFALFAKYFLKSLFLSRFIVHITGGCNYMVMAFPFKKRVLTIHDFFHYNTKKGLKGKLYDLLFFRLPIRFAHQIIVVSQQTKDTLAEHFPKHQNKAHVIVNPLVIDQKFVEYKERDLVNRPLKVLQIGDKPLKNYERLLAATHDLPVHYYMVHAKDTAVTMLQETFAVPEKITHLCGISDQELYNLYKDCDILFFASTAEGFGLPILEAQAFGMPVVTSNIPPMSSVGVGAFLVDPFNTQDIRAAFEHLLAEPNLENNYTLAKKNLAQYLAPTVAAHYLNSYKQLV